MKLRKLTPRKLRNLVAYCKPYQNRTIPVTIAPILLGIAILTAGMLPAHAQNCDASFYGAQKGSGAKAGFIDSSNFRGAKHNWYFGDGTKLLDTTHYLDHNYNQFGQFNVCHVVVDSNCKDSTCQQVSISCDTTANFTYSEMGNGKVSFSSNTAGVAYKWKFGDGKQGQGRTTSHTYSDSGQYTVTLDVVKDTSPYCAGETTKQIQVNSQSSSCNVQASFDIRGNGYQRTFIPNTNASIYTWDLGDGSSTNQSTVTHTYGKKDTYDVKLVVKDGPNCADSTTKQVIIRNDNTIAGSLDLKGGQLSRGDTIAVKLYHYDSCKGVYNKIRSQYARVGVDSGTYQFKNLPAGKFHIKAMPAKGGSLSNSYVATYHKQASQWNKADSIILNGLGKSSYGNKITLLKSSSSSGSGSITGFVGGSKAQCTNKRLPEEDAIGNLPVVLLNEDREPVARTRTGEDGKYQFKNLALTSYFVRVDFPGYKAEDKAVSLTGEASEQNADFTVNGNQIKSEEETAVESPVKTEPAVKIYPTPARNQINVNIAEAEADQLRVIITNVKGQIMTQQRIGTAAANQNVQLNVSEWQAGAYILQLQDQNGRTKAARKLMVR